MRPAYSNKLCADDMLVRARHYEWALYGWLRLPSPAGSRDMFE